MQQGISTAEGERVQLDLDSKIKEILKWVRA